MARRKRKSVAEMHHINQVVKKVVSDSPELSMRGLLDDRSRPSPRRLTADRLAVEDLRRENHFLTDNFADPTYRKIDGSIAQAVSVEVPVRSQKITGNFKAGKITGNSRLQRKFTDPERTLVCVRRKERREVLFAMNKTGRGGRKNRRARWTAKSRIGCK